MNKNKTIGVLGATGNIGNELIKILSRNKEISVCAFSRSLDKAKKMPWKNIEIRHFDFFKLDKNVFNNIDEIFWLIPENESPEKKWLEICKNASVKHLVMLSSIYPDIFDMRSSEILVQQSGIPCTILRPNTFMQNFNNYDKDSIVNKSEFYYPAGLSKTSFIDVRDIAEAAANILLNDQYKNKIYTLTGDESLNYYQAAELLSKAYGKSIFYIDTFNHPELESEEKKKDIIWQKFFAGVRDGLFSEVTKDLQQLLGRPAKTFQQYAQDYWVNKK